MLIALCAGLLFAADAFALDAGDTLRVMTYNIQYAYCFDDNKTPHPETVATSATLPADATNFPLAATGSRISEIGFDGEGSIRSIFGNFSLGFYLRLR